MKELLLFSTMLVFIEIVIPIRIANAICLIVTLAIYAFEDVRTRLSFFDSCLIHFLVFHATLSNIKTMIDNVLHQRTALGIPDIHPNHCYIRFGRCSDNIWF